MRLNEDLLERVEEFFDMVPNDNGDVDLDFAMDRLRCLLEEDIDGVTHYAEDELAFKILCRMEDLWDLIPETNRDSNLQEYYEEIMQDLERITAAESDACFSEFEAEEDEE